jgi:hypothetical protein
VVTEILLSVTLSICDELVTVCHLKSTVANRALLEAVVFSLINMLRKCWSTAGPYGWPIKCTLMICCVHSKTFQNGLSGPRQQRKLLILRHVSETL